MLRFSFGPLFRYPRFEFISAFGADTRGHMLIYYIYFIQSNRTNILQCLRCRLISSHRHIHVFVYVSYYSIALQFTRINFCFFHSFKLHTVLIEFYCLFEYACYLKYIEIARRCAINQIVCAKYYHCGVIYYCYYCWIFIWLRPMQWWIICMLVSFLDCWKVPTTRQARISHESAKYDMYVRVFPNICQFENSSSTQLPPK